MSFLSRFGILCIFVVTLGAAHGSDHLDKKAMEEVIDKIAEGLQQQYVFEPLGIKAGDLVRRRLAEGVYDNIKDKTAFAEQLTEDLQSVTSDKHMRVRHSPPVRNDSGVQEHPILSAVRRQVEFRSHNSGFAAVEVLEGNVGYLDLRSFTRVNLMKAQTDHAMGLLAQVDAFVLDLRKNGGGDPRAVQLLCSYFIKGGVHINSLYYRHTNTTTDFHTLEQVDGTRLLDVPLFVLTSGGTFSAAEECAYNLRTQKRATLIGEITGGGANPGGTVGVGHDLGIFIPSGRAINPVTGTNWEGVGVIPHLETTSDAAYEMGLEKARQAADGYREAKLTLAKAQIKTLSAAVDTAKKQFEKGDMEGGFKVLSASMAKGYQAGTLSENVVNLLGYSYMKKDTLAISQAIFRVNTNQYPNSPNVFDSYGDALDQGGELTLAIEAYANAVSLAEKTDNPDIDYFRKNLARAKGKAQMYSNIR